MVSDKLCPSFCVKWKEYKIDKGLNTDNLLDCDKLIRGQADIQDDFGVRVNKAPTNQSDLGVARILETDSL